MLLAVDPITMYFGMEGLFHLTRRTAEFNAAASGRDAIHRKTLRVQPAGHGIEISLGDSQLLAELSRREPLVITLRSRVLLGRQQALDRGFLAGAAGKVKHHTSHGQAGVSPPDIASSVGQRVGGSWKADCR